MDAYSALRNWINEAKNAEISNTAIDELTEQLLKNYQVIQPLVKGIGIEIKDLVKEVWGLKKKKAKE
ncbi:MAG: hypothetical protein HY424_01915 [Candidatus Levybacteria bacterium]|nr:hypothetical protein [Candidatus Levybacteria bacterium]